MGSTFTTYKGVKSDSSLFSNSKPIPIYLQFVPGIVIDVVTSSESKTFAANMRNINSILAIPHVGKKTLTRSGTVGEDNRYYPLFRGTSDVPTKGDPVLLCTIGNIQYYLGPLNTINNPNWNVMTLTNLSRSKDFIDQWVHKTDWIVTSFHPNVIKTQAQRDKWFEKALSYKKKTLLNIKILMDPLHWDYCLDKYNSLNDEDISLTPVRIHNVAEATRPQTYIHYTPEQEKILSNLKAKMGNNLRKEASPIPERETTLKYDDGEEQTSIGAFDAWHITSQIMRHDRNKFKGWLCRMGLDNLHIDEKGNIYRGICATDKQTSVGHITELHHVKWPVSPTICPKTYCYCEGEVGITKRKLKSAEIKLIRDKIK